RIPVGKELMSSPLPRRKTSFFRASLAALALVAAGTTLGGCPGTLDPSLLDSGPKVCDAPTLVLAMDNMQTGCGSNTGCHAATAHEAGLDLVTAGVVGRLLGKAPNPTTSVSCMASTTQYLIANTMPAQGLLIDKLSSPPSCGSAMPFPLGGLPATQRTCLM